MSDIESPEDTAARILRCTCPYATEAHQGECAQQRAAVADAIRTAVDAEREAIASEFDDWGPRFLMATPAEVARAIRADTIRARQV